MNFLGDDIKLNEPGDMQINIGSGDFSTAKGIECLLQDIIEEFDFPYNDDPDHPERGNGFMRFINSDSDNPLTAIEMKQEAKQILYRDPRVKKNSAVIDAVPGPEGYADISFYTIDGQKVENLVIPVSGEIKL